MIRLRRFGQTEFFYLNPDLVLSVESTPDTVVTLINQSKVLVIEPPSEVIEAIREWRASIVSIAAFYDARGAR